MTKSLASFPEQDRLRIAQRRLKNQTKGNGYWAAVAFMGRQSFNKLPNNKDERGDIINAVRALKGNG